MVLALASFKLPKGCSCVPLSSDDDEELAYAHAFEGDEYENRESFYRDDPLKILSRFFEGEGFDMEFSYEESGAGSNHKWTCAIE